MRANRAVRWVLMGGAVVGAVLLTSGCGGKEVTFTPAANSSGAVQPADGSAPPATSTSGAPSSGSSGSAVATPPNIAISTQGSSICVRNKDTGSEACVSRQGTAVVNGVVIVDGKVVSTAGSGSGDGVVVNGGGSVVSGGGSVVVGDDPPPVPTSGTVTLGGAVQWHGSAKGTCRRKGEVRHAEVTLGNGGRLSVDVVGTGVVRMELSSGGDDFSGNWVGDNGFVSLGDKTLTVNQAPLGRDSGSVRLSATLNC